MAILDPNTDSKLKIFNLWPELVQFESKIRFLNITFAGEPTLLTKTPKNIAEEIEEEYNNGGRFFVFELISESMYQSIIVHIHNALNLIPKNILDCISLNYATGDIFGNTSYHRICHIQKFPKILNILCGNHFEQSIKNSLNLSNPYTVGKKDKKFLCFNNIPRLHRIILLEKLLSKNLVDDSYYSFNFNPHIPHPFDGMLDKNLYPSIISNKEKFPMILNRVTGSDINVDDVKYFDNSYFSIVADTLFFNPFIPIKNYKDYLSMDYVPGFHPNEKIFKCIVLRHPFIVLGTRRFLKGLHSLGYRTFHPYINESYDNVVDDLQRLELVVKEIQKLCSLPESELINLTYQFKEIVEHNFNVLNTKTDFRITKDLNNLIFQK